MDSNLKLCVDCKYYIKGTKGFFKGETDQCKYSGTLINPVTGEKWSRKTGYPLDYRSHELHCGSKARFFEPKK